MKKQCKVCGKTVDTKTAKFIGVQEGYGYDLYLYNCTCNGTVSFKIMHKNNKTEVFYAR